MRQDDAEERQSGRHIACGTEGLDAVDRVQRNPADHEEQHYDREVLGGLDVPLPGGPQNPQHCARVSSSSGSRHLYHCRRGATTEIGGGVHRYDLTDLGLGEFNLIRKWR